MFRTDLKSFVIKDPIHGVMDIGSNEKNWLKPFIDHPVFQRLRYIKQMGLADFVFPSAVHNRFSHSIGASYVSKKIAEQLNLSEKEKQKLFIACLLHDIGHGPLSHTFETIFPINNVYISHEEWTKYFLEEFMSEEFLLHYNKMNQGFPLEKNLIKKVTNLIMFPNEQEGNDKILSDIISSQLDADRLDYLLRDSHFCGVVYGTYDLDWLINCMTICKNENGRESIAVSIKGVGTVEQYLLARGLMSKMVYFHKVIVAAEFLVIQLLRSILEISSEKIRLLSQIFPSPLLKFLEIIKLINARNKFDIMQQSYPYYKQLGDFDVISLIRFLVNHKEVNGLELTKKIANLLYKRVLPISFRINENKTDLAKQLILEVKNAMKLMDWQLYFYQPKITLYKHNLSPILICDQGKIPSTLTIESKMVNYMSTTDENLLLLLIDRDLISNRNIAKLLEKLKKENYFIS